MVTVAMRPWRTGQTAVMESGSFALEVPRDKAVVDVVTG
jgi:hypothetical protein